MEQWLLEHATWIVGSIVSAVGLGGLSILLKKSWTQSVRLYHDDLVQCQSREDGHKETIAYLRETIAYQEERSTYREDRMAELLAEIGALREKQHEFNRTTRRTTTSRKPSSSQPTS